MCKACCDFGHTPFCSGKTVLFFAFFKYGWSQDNFKHTGTFDDFLKALKTAEIMITGLDNFIKMLGSDAKSRIIVIFF